MEILNENLDYCFLSDVGCGEFENGSLSTNFMINNKRYVDPDSKSKKLYTCHEKFWPIFNKNKSLKNISLKIIEHKYNGYGKYDPWYEIEFKKDDRTYYLTSDYIGASKNWALKKGIPLKEINKYLLEARKFGSHLLFWRHSEVDYDCWCEYYDKEIANFIKVDYRDKIEKPYKKITINTAKGGNKGIFDRIDWTMKLLKVYFSCMNEENFDLRRKLFIDDQAVKSLLDYKEFTTDEKELSFNPSNSVSRLFYAFENSREWLKEFEFFQGFTSYFAFEDLIDENKEVKELAPWFPVLPNQYKEYMDRTLDFILQRKLSLVINK